MCIIIDTCCLSNVFESGNAAHADFKPVLLWVAFGKGKIVIGGAKYKKELRKAGRYIPILAQMAKAGRIVSLCDAEVDKAEQYVMSKELDPDFDDAHLIAMVIVSRCRVVCTSDKRAHSFLRKKSLYPKGQKRPSIYARKIHKALLSDQNIVGKCLRKR